MAKAAGRSRRQKVFRQQKAGRTQKSGRLFIGSGALPVDYPDRGTEAAPSIPGARKARYSFSRVSSARLKACSNATKSSPGLS